MAAVRATAAARCGQGQTRAAASRAAVDARRVERVV
jgi:hypothetical protein